MPPQRRRSAGRRSGQRVAVLILATVAASVTTRLPAQDPPDQHDPSTTPTRIRALLRDGDTPMPGVPIVIGMRSHEPPAEVVDGWLVARDDEAPHFTLSRTLRTDPNGDIVLPMTEGQPSFVVVAGAPFRGNRLEAAADGDGWVLRVERLHEVRAFAVDHEDRPLVDFAVEVVSNGRTLARATTDARGYATFGLEPRVTVRSSVVPAHWRGDVGDFPTVSSAQPNTTVTVRVPPHGTVRVRALRGGEPGRTRVHGVDLSSPARASIVRRRSDGHGVLGVAFDRVPLQQEIRGTLRADEAAMPFVGRGPTRAGEVVTIDVETDPPRPRIGFTASAADGSALRAGTSVHVCVATDTRRFHEYRPVAEDGRVLTHSLLRRLEGTAVRRVDADVTVRDEHGTLRAFSATHAVDLPLADTVLELGDVRLEPHPPLLCGRVVGDDGKPVANARVTVQAAPEAFAWLQQVTTSDAAGAFVVHGPLPRGDDGAVLPVRAWAAVGQGLATEETAATGTLAAFSEIVLTTSRPATGMLALRLAENGLALRSMLQFRLVDGNGHTRIVEPSALQWSPNGDGTATLGPLPVGTFDLGVDLRPGVPLRNLGKVTIQRGVTTHAPALRELDLGHLVQHKRLCIVDESGVPVPRTTIEYGIAGRTGTCSITSSDDGGFVSVLFGPRDLVITARADGKEPVLLTGLEGLADGAPVRLDPRRSLCVRVLGLPPDVPRERLHVLLRPVPRDQLADVVHVPLGAGDSAAVPRPRAGSYWLRIVVDTAPPGAGMRGTLVHQKADPVLVADGAPSDFEVALDEAAIEAIQKAIQKALGR
jgi:hypothetical protein